MDKKKKRYRVPWHVTLFTGAAWFLLAGGAQPSVLAVSGLMIAGGVFYILWPRLRKKTPGPDGDEEKG